MKSLRLLPLFPLAGLLAAACSGKPSTVTGTPDFTVTMDELAKQVADTSFHASEKYRGKLIALRGKVERVDQTYASQADEADDLAVKLISSDSSFHAEARMSDEAAAAAKKYQPGQQIKLVCKCSGIDFLAQFQDCRVEE